MGADIALLPTYLSRFTFACKKSGARDWPGGIFFLLFRRSRPDILRARGEIPGARVSRDARTGKPDGRPDLAGSRVDLEFGGSPIASESDGRSGGAGPIRGRAGRRTTPRVMSDGERHPLLLFSQQSSSCCAGSETHSHCALSWVIEERRLCKEDGRNDSLRIVRESEL